MRIPQLVTYVAVEKGKKTKVNFGKTMMQALELLWLAATVYSEEIKPVALAIIELCFSEGISQSVSQ